MSKTSSFLHFLVLCFLNKINTYEAVFHVNKNQTEKDQL